MQKEPSGHLSGPTTLFDVVTSHHDLRESNESVNPKFVSLCVANDDLSHIRRLDSALLRIEAII